MVSRKRRTLNLLAILVGAVFIIGAVVQVHQHHHESPTGTVGLRRPPPPPPNARSLRDGPASWLVPELAPALGSDAPCTDDSSFVDDVGQTCASWHWRNAHICTARGYLAYCHTDDGGVALGGRDAATERPGRCRRAADACCACRRAPRLSDAQRKAVPPDPRGYVLDEGLWGAWRGDPKHIWANPREEAGADTVAAKARTAAPRRISLAIAHNRLDDPLVAASIAQKRAYAERHGYSLYLHSTFKGMYHHPNGHIDLGLEGAWAKFILAYELFLAAPSDGGWVWVLDADIVIMDLAKPLAPLLDKAEKNNYHIVAVNWDCGDGVNTGSVLMRNVEWTRTYLRRLRDEHVVWDLYFYSGGHGRHDQSAWWTVGEADASAGRYTWHAPSRLLNARDSTIVCAKKASTAKRVYYRPGDFLVHLAAVNRDIFGKELFAHRLAATGWWPCPDDAGCTEAALLRAIPSRPTTAIARRQPSAQQHGGKPRLTIVLAGERQPTAAAEDQQSDAPIRGDEIVRLTQRHQVVVEARARVDFFRPTKAKKYLDEELNRVGGRILPREGGWTGVAAAWWVAAAEKADLLAHDASAVRRYLRGKGGGVGLPREGDWILLCRGSGTCLTQLRPGSTLAALIDRVLAASAPEGAKPKQFYVRPDCRGPWLMRVSEFTRSLLHRVADGFIVRYVRLKAKGFIRGEKGKVRGELYARQKEKRHKVWMQQMNKIVLPPEERAAADPSETLCRILNKDPVSAEEVGWME